MKYLKNSALIFLTVIMACCICSSCRNAGKYADDVWKAVDDKVDDIKIRPKRAPQQKTCTQCNGSGKVYDAYWNAYECSKCGGDGKVLFN